MPTWRHRLRARLMPAVLDTSKQPILWLLLTLIAVFGIGMLVLSSLNLDYSQKAMAALRKAQIEETFHASLNRIDAQQGLHEHYTEDLARLGELFWQLRQRPAAGLSDALQQTLAQKLRDIDDVFGVGIWFKPGEFSPLTLYVHRNMNGHADLSTDAYTEQPWYALTIPPDSPAQASPMRQFYWSPAYYNAGSKAAVLTLASPMYNPRGELIGYATTDWRAERIIELISRVDITPNTFAFLLDRNNRKLSSLNEMGDSLHVQRIIDAVLLEDLTQDLPARSATILPGVGKDQQFQSRDIWVEGREYALYYAAIHGDMLFGIGLPRDEIDAVLTPMRSSNYQILATTGLVMLVLSILLAYKLFGVLRELQASYTDELTQLPNRARLMQDLSARDAGSMVLLNLDRFEEINGLFGYACGDQVLKTLGSRLRQMMDQDPLLHDACLYRLTADEFALLLPALAEPELQTLLEHLEQFVQDLHVLWMDQEIDLGATLGAATSPARATDPSQLPGNLMSWATIALKQARQQQRSFHIYDTAQRIELSYEYNLLWAARVKEALRDDLIVPWYQPIHNNQTGEITKYECLIRMQDKQGSVINPGSFLEVARKLRLDRQITRIMLDKCFAAFSNQPCEFSINLSYADLIDDELSAFIRRRLEETGAGPRIIFEILESDGIENYQHARHFIDEVKAYGCRIAIDDFGTGYSNFEYLLRLDVDLIKIDGSLIRQLDSDTNAMILTQGIVNFAHSLGIATVAEYVHSAVIQERVVQLGIDFSQGEYIGMPTARPTAHLDSETC